MKILTAILIFANLKKQPIFSDMSRTIISSPEGFSGYFMKKRKWPLKGYHRRYFSIENGVLKYGKNPELRKIHGTADMGGAIISQNKKGDEIHIGKVRL